MTATTATAIDLSGLEFADLQPPGGPRSWPGRAYAGCAGAARSAHVHAARFANSGASVVIWLAASPFTIESAAPIVAPCPGRSDGSGPAAALRRAPAALRADAGNGRLMRCV